ncbi:hypothetical protein V22_27730 [Calycomorphotria hydatis]|uniref:Uncharacterized protein n=1 Tax=Calycomorphotria hydatis TaxID=2528027 RepID=A0A517TAW8_9PLAN|nr:hypothetical protein V22_27730 [Calycomorphotria hydatis]
MLGGTGNASVAKQPEVVWEIGKHSMSEMSLAAAPTTSDGYRRPDDVRATRRIPSFNTAAAMNQSSATTHQSRLQDWSPLQSPVAGAIARLAYCGRRDDNGR